MQTVDLVRQLLETLPDPYKGAAIRQMDPEFIERRHSEILHEPKIPRPLLGYRDALVTES